MPSKVLTFSTAGRYVLTFLIVGAEVSGAKVRTIPIMFSIFPGSCSTPKAYDFVVPESLETKPFN